MQLDYEVLEKSLCYSFVNKDLLGRALSHRSYCHEFSRRKTKEQRGDNERLEFLGDAVLQLAISHILLEKYPEADEGKLSKMRSFLVNANSLTEMAKSIELGSYLLLGKGEEVSGGKEKSSILSAAYEAVLGAIYMEAGFGVVFKIVAKHFQVYLEQAEGAIASGYDFKSLLQERARQYFCCMPSYEVKSIEGPDHRKLFTVTAKILSDMATGKGENKKEAEQAAAHSLLKIIEKKQIEDRNASHSI